MNILVTGGAGFVGSNLIKRLVLAGHTIVSLDNYFAGSVANHIPGVEYIKGHTKNIENLVAESYDLVFHLGEYSRTEKSLTEPELVWDLNSAGTMAVLEYCRKRNVRIIYAGSSTKFADDGAGKYQSPYAYSKATNSELVRNYGQWYGLPYAIAYFYNVYGPGERGEGPYATLIEIFKQKFLRGEPLIVTAPGTQRRIFTHVDDIVDGLMLIAEKGQGDDYGLGADESYSVLEIARMFSTDIIIGPEKPGNRMSANLDATKSKTLGWSAKRRVEDYIKDIVKNKN
ncbi:MAG TPA: NAD-dependent epimerase/dehydratase family protein [Patescibacteria group bacterium]|nr:NAD-dependent epimerase/dehydratase family protein [Patescibacteria group bacterium]